MWLVSKSQLVLWICRVLSFFWIFVYHDYQSVVVLIWFLHSTLYDNSRIFKKFMTYFYLPLFTMIFIFYYTINIYGFIIWPAKDDPNRISHYKYGFYKFNVPPLETCFMYLNLFFFTQLTFLLEDDKDSDINKSKKLIDKLGGKKSSLIYQFIFLFLIYIEYPLMLFLVMAGLDKMDVYHITMLVFFLIYTLFPKFINEKPIILLLYANFFVLEKYLFTLITK